MANYVTNEREKREKVSFEHSTTIDCYVARLWDKLKSHNTNQLCLMFSIIHHLFLFFPFFSLLFLMQKHLSWEKKKKKK